MRSENDAWPTSLESTEWVGARSSSALSLPGSEGVLASVGEGSDGGNVIVDGSYTYVNQPQDRICTIVEADHITMVAGGKRVGMFDRCSVGSLSGEPVLPKTDRVTEPRRTPSAAFSSTRLNVSSPPSLLRFRYVKPLPSSSSPTIAVTLRLSGLGTTAVCFVFPFIACAWLGAAFRLGETSARTRRVGIGGCGCVDCISKRCAGRLCQVTRPSGAEKIHESARDLPDLSR